MACILLHTACAMSLLGCSGGFSAGAWDGGRRLAGAMRVDRCAAVEALGPRGGRVWAPQQGSGLVRCRMGFAMAEGWGKRENVRCTLVTLSSNPRGPKDAGAGGQGANASAAVPGSGTGAGNKAQQGSAPPPRAKILSDQEVAERNRAPPPPPRSGSRAATSGGSARAGAREAVPSRLESAGQPQRLGSAGPPPRLGSTGLPQRLGSTGARSAPTPSPSSSAYLQALSAPMDAETKKKRPVYSTTPMWTPKAKPPTKAKELEEEAAAEKKKSLQKKDAGFREDIAIKVAAKKSKGKALDGDGLCP